MACDLPRGLYHLPDRVALSIAQVVGPAACVQRLQGQDVRMRQVQHVDIVADAGAVAGGIVVAKDFYVFPLAQCNLQHQGDEVGLGVVILTPIGRRARGVEIAQRRVAKAVDAIQPVQRPLQD